MITTNRKFSSLSSPQPLTEIETSFMLMRTNPVMTGNVKITVDSLQNIWLNSFDANPELSNIQFKKFKIFPNSSYAIDLKRFFNNGKLPASIVYDKFEKDSTYSSTKRNLSEQFDNFYAAGAEQLVTKLYEEDYSFFAPIYLNKILPQYFVILRANNPFSLETREKATWNEMIKDSSIVKTFDLTAKSDIGKYIHKIVSNSEYKTNPLSVNFDKESLTTWNGIAYDKGIYGYRGEKLNDYFKSDRPQIEFEEYITNGFVRNKIISSNILNLEFLFNDDEAETFSINRYWGIYVSENELANFVTSATGLKLDSTSGQTPMLDDVTFYSMSEKEILQTNPNGVIVYGSIDGVADFDKISGKVDLDVVEKNDQLFYIKDKKNNFYKVNHIDQWATDSLRSIFFESTYRFHLSNKYVNQGNFLGKADLTVQAKCERVLEQTYAQQILDIKKEIGPGDFIEIAWKTPVSSYRYRVIANNTPHEWELNIDSLIGDTISVTGDYTQLFWQTDKVTFFDGDLPFEFNCVDDGLNMSAFMDVISMEYDSILNVTKFKIKDLASLPYINSKVNLYSKDYYLNEPIYNGTGDFEYTFVNCYGGNEQTLKNISNAFFSFETRSYHSLGIGSKFVFIVAQPGSWGNAFSVKFTHDLATCSNEVFTSSIMSLSSCDNLVLVNEICEESYFRGGSDIIGEVIKVKKEVSDQAKQFLNNYASTVEGYARIKGIYSYVQRPIFDDELLVGFEDFDNDIIILERDKWYLNSFSEFNLYEKYRASYGVLSIFPIRDFDTDFYSDRYSKNHVQELDALFREYNEDESLHNNMQFYVDGSIDLYSTETVFASIDFFKSYSPEVNKPAYIILNGDYTTTALEAYQDVAFISEDGDIETQINAKIESIELLSGKTKITLAGQLKFGSIFNLKIKVRKFVTTITNSNFLAHPTNIQFFKKKTAETMVFLDFIELDEDLNSFKGFSGLSDDLSIEDENKLRDLISIANKSIAERSSDRKQVLSWKLVRSEYFRLKENFIKEFALKSRVVPHILKWGLKGGKDIRDNPYRLNVSRNFGVSNFSPLATRAQSPESFSHEWLYIDKVPKNLDLQNLDKSFGYFYEDISVLEDLAKKGNASYYLTVGYPLEKAADVIDKDLNSKFQSILQKKSERFSKFEMNANIEEVYTFFKGIRIQINELIPGTREIRKGSSKYSGYTFSTILTEQKSNINENLPPISYKIVEFESSKHIQLIVEFNLVDYRDILDYTALYSLQSKKKYASDSVGNDGKFHLKYDDHVLSSSLSLGRPSSNLSNGVNLIKTIPYKVKNLHTGTYDIVFETNLFDEILVNLNGGYTTTKALDLNGDENFTSIGINFLEGYDTDSTLFDFELTNMTGLKSSDTIKIPEGKMYRSIKDQNSFSVRDTAFFLDEFWAHTTATYYEGGRLVNKNMLNRISFAEISKLINENSTQIQYYKINSKGLKEASNFKLEIIQPHEILQNDMIITEVDNNKPDALQMVNVIGYNLNRKNEKQILYRYGGNYEPIFRDIIDFALTENLDSPYTYNRNTSVIPNKDFGVIQNMFINKVADKEILGIQQNISFPSKYPLINEVAIDKQDQYIFSSTWDKNYFRKYSNISNFNLIDGTSEMKEFKSFFGSKMMQVEREIQLLGLGDFTFEDDLSKECIISLGGSNTKLRFLFENRLVKYFLSNGVLNKFLEFEVKFPGIWGNSGAEKMASDYIRQNVLNLYFLKDIQIFSKTVNASINLYQDNDLIENLFNKGYSIDKNVKPVIISKFIYDIEKNINPGEIKNISAIIKFYRI